MTQAIFKNWLVYSFCESSWKRYLRHPTRHPFASLAIWRAIHYKINLLTFKISADKP